MSRANLSPRFEIRHLLASSGAVAAGFATTFALSVATDAVLHLTRVFPQSGQPMTTALFVVATAYRGLPLPERALARSPTRWSE